jgi:LysM repeat protein
MTTSMLMLDRAQAPNLGQAKAALDEVGGTAWAYYLGGAGHFHDHTTYSPKLVTQYRDAGIRTLPIYGGAQSGFSRARGLADAKDAASRARDFGDARTPVMCDIERGPHDRDPGAALAYARGWSAGLHAAGLRAGVYGPFQLMLALTGASDVADVPDVLWPARWIADAGVLPQRNHWPDDARKVKGVPQDKLAKPGARAWQFVGDVVLPQSRLNVDISVIDLNCFERGATPVVPHPTPVPNPVPVPHPTPSGRTVTVRAGDTLSAIEKAHGLPFGSLFARNATLLDQTAQRHGQPDSRHGGLIFPGTVLALP